MSRFQKLSHILIPRFFSIFVDRFKNLTFGDFLVSVKMALFRDDPMIIYALDTSNIEKTTDNTLGKVAIRKGDIEELEKAAGQFRSAPWEFQCHKYDKVKDFFIASDGKEIQHIIWIYYQNDPNRLIRLGPKDAEVKYGLTLPPFRGQGIYPMVLKTLLRYLKQKGFNRVYGFIHEDNHPSIRGFEKVGFKPIGRIRLRKVLGIQISKRYVPQEA